MSILESGLLMAAFRLSSEARKNVCGGRCAEAASKRALDPRLPLPSKEKHRGCLSNVFLLDLRSSIHTKNRKNMRSLEIAIRLRIDFT
jgi:hypothetical protein